MPTCICRLPFAKADAGTPRENRGTVKYDSAFGAATVTDVTSTHVLKRKIWAADKNSYSSKTLAQSYAFLRREALWIAGHF
jgi:hypothetical protein